MNYATDEQIESFYRHAKVRVHFDDDRRNSGGVELEFPHASESDYLDETMYNGFIIYSHNGKIAFDHWLPEVLNHEVCRKIRQERRK